MILILKEPVGITWHSISFDSSFATFHSFPYLEVPVPTDRETLTISLATPKPFEVSRIVLRFNSFH